MARTLYLDIFSGISGDMFIGALLDLGVDFNTLEAEVARLGVDGYHLHAARRQKANIQGVKFDVHLEHEEHSHAHNGDASHSHSHQHEHSHSHEHEHSHSHSHEHGHEHGHSHDHPPGHHHHHDHGQGRNFADIQKLISESTLSDWVKQKSTAVFRRVAEAEGKVHGMPPHEVHFHEVGAVDSIVDIIGACAALELLGRPRVLAAPIVEGTGWVDCAHGRFPVPTAATLEILGARGFAVTQCEEPQELVTPTGAALLAEFAENCGPMLDLIPEKIGYGLGTRDCKTRPNVLRACLGTSSTQTTDSHRLDWETDEIAVLETNLDDINAELLGHFIEKSIAEGALDAFHTPIQMKKNRPGILLTVLCRASEADRFSELMLRETSAFGIRKTVAHRRKLRRENITVGTAHGEVSVKLGRLNDRAIQIAPEFESCRSLAEKENIPLNDIYRAALHAAQQQIDPS